MYIIKLSIFLFFTITLASLCLPVLLLLYPLRISIGPCLVQFYAKICLIIFRVKIEYKEKIKIQDKKNKKIILLANHVSYLDIFLLAALYRTLYVSKIEVKHYPVIGQIASIIGIIFLKRSSPEERHKIIRTIANEPYKRILTIFPQGTTSSIANPIPFKAGIFKTVEINPMIVLIPVSIHYKEDNEIAWTEEQILIDNVKSVCSMNKIHVKVKLHESISISDYQNKSISEICASAQEKVFSELRKKY
jgi:1-acyl-sn-glycerol-3-phosphate acyltransferase